MNTIACRKYAQYGLQKICTLWLVSRVLIFPPSQFSDGRKLKQEAITFQDCLVGKYELFSEQISLIGYKKTIPLNLQQQPIIV